MKISLLLFLIGVSFVGFSSAQLCGEYRTVLNVLSEKGEKIDAALVQLIPLERDETRGRVFVQDQENRSEYYISFFEGHQLSSKYKVIVSASGYEEVELEIKFPHCKRQRFEFRLEPFTKDGSRAVLTGVIYDPVGAVIPKSKITALDQKGKKFETLTNEDGEYSLNLPFNTDSRAGVAKYEITIEAGLPGFEKAVLKDFKFVGAHTGEMRLDLALDVAGSANGNCGAGGCITEETAPIEVKPTKITGEILQQPLEKLPKEQNKTKRKNKNNKQ